MEVHARRLDSPLDSILKITDANGGMLAVNDDHEDPATGVNTHHADSYLMTSLPADGKYFIHIGDVSRNGGPAYGYRLRISPPRPDFELRVVPSSASFRSKGGTSVMVHAIRKDGFAGDIRLELKDSSEGFAARWVVLKAGQEQVRMALKTTLVRSNQPVPLQITGTAQINKREVKRLAVPAEDRMQAFLWRHLVPAEELLAFVYNPADKPASKRTPDPNAGQRPVKKVQATGATPPQFTKRQVAGRLRQLKSLYEEFLLTDAFYNQQVAECETAFD